VTDVLIITQLHEASPNCLNAWAL